MNIQSAFSTAAVMLPPLKSERAVIAHCFDIAVHADQWFEAHRFSKARIALALLMDKKTYDEADRKVIRMRRDHVTPDFLHEMRQVYAVLAHHEAGLIPEDYLEDLMVTVLTHDLGEDFRVCPDEICSLFREKLGDEAADHNLEYDAWRMETLTLDRKFSPDDVARRLGLKPGTKIYPRHLHRLADSLEETASSAHQYMRLEPMQFFSKPDHKGRYTFSRYIQNGIVDWNLYAQAFSADKLTAITKMLDRNEGLSTRIGKNFDLSDYNDYLSRTNLIFSVDGLGQRMAGRFPDFSQAILSLDAMMGALHRIGDAYLTYHPSRNLPGRKGFNIETMAPVSFRHYFPAAMTGYQHMAAGMMPLHIILMRIKASNELGNRANILHQNLLYSIYENANQNILATAPPEPAAPPALSWDI